MEKGIELYTKRVLKNFNFQNIFLNLNIPVNNRWKIMKICRLVVESHLEGTMSQIFYLGSSFYFMKCRKLI